MLEVEVVASEEVGEMNWVGESQGCPEAIKAAGIQMACLLELDKRWYRAQLQWPLTTTRWQVAPSWPSRLCLPPLPPGSLKAYP